ncbi:hypothetical protein [Janthinobacterium sp. PC23-8]|uniref:hypothetical protein n=1 Tax=Janthinobacterium sp. PC23-8 TaxID=2012679 RepID=UPI000B97A06F|nr:hypothetical protein [Janthinobacterium sp. PC23-8]OYO29095.1 hypothetical protein CD932_18475 [Janthinobacterium sp. PC23-8]
MPYTLIRPFSTCFAALVIATVLSGCATFKSVDEFAQTSQQMTATFAPIANATVDSCLENALRKKLISSEGFDPAAVETQARIGCDEIAESNKKVVRLNGILVRYAETLGNLSGSKVADYHDEFSGLGEALGSIELPGSSTPLLDPSQVNIAMKLSEYLGRLLTQNMQKSAISDLLDQQEAVNMISSALNTYVQTAYQYRIDIERRDSGELHSALNATARSEPLATNYVKVRLYRDEKQLSERAKIPDAYAKAVTAFQDSVKNLRNEKQQDDSERLRQQLLAFSERVDELKHQVAFLAPAKW